MLKNIRKEGRNLTIDLLKAFAAILVILSHSLLKFIDSTQHNLFYNILFNFIWLTQMPLFMFISGFLNNKSEKFKTFRDFLYQILRNSFTLLVPLLTFIIISSLISGTSLANSFVLFYKNPENYLWFLWVLFILHLVFDFGHYLTNKINIKGKKFIPVFLHFLVVLTIFILMFVFKDGDFKVLGIKLTGYYAIFYSFGYVFNLYIKSVFSTSKKGVILNYVILSLSLVILLFEVFYFESIYDFDDTNIKYILIRLIGSASAIIVNIFLFDYLAKFKIFNKISSLGRFSLESYYLHVIFLRYINFSVLTPGMAWLMTFTISILLATLVALTLMFMYYIPYLHLILFGRSLSVYQFEKKLPKILR